MTDSAYTPATSELLNLNEKTAVVTGGASGIGFAISRRLAQSGAFVFIADVDLEEAQKACGKLTADGLHVSPIECDVSNEKSVKLMAEKIAEEKYGIDILVNNAGIFPMKPLAYMTGDEFELVQAVNLKGAFLCSREAAKHMMAKPSGGCIINITSIGAIHPSGPGMAAYDSSKAGLAMLTKSLARELGPYDIRVNAVAPGGILTAGFGKMTQSQSISEGKSRLKAFMAHLALGRMGEPDEVARAVLFLASPMASYITGCTIMVDGGYLVS